MDLNKLCDNNNNNNNNNLNRKKSATSENSTGNNYLRFFSTWSWMSDYHNIFETKIAWQHLHFFAVAMHSWTTKSIIGRVKTGYDGKLTR